MKILIESTSKIVTLVINGTEVPARIWEGLTMRGVPVHCYVTRINPVIPEGHPDIEVACEEFERELRHVTAPSPSVAGIPLRLIL